VSGLSLFRLRKRFRRFTTTGGEFALPLDSHQVKGVPAPDNPDQGRLPLSLWTPIDQRAHRCPLEPKTGVSAPASTKRKLRLSLWKPIDQDGDPGPQPEAHSAWANTEKREYGTRGMREEELSPIEIEWRP